MIQLVRQTVKICITSRLAETTYGLTRSLSLMTSQSSKPIITLFTKSECSLCDDLVDEMEPYLHLVNFKKVDITTPENKFWYGRYRYEIPVLHLNGKFLMKHRFDKELFMRSLQNLTADATKN